MKVVFLGATRGIGRALSRMLVEQGDQLFILGHEKDENADTAADLAARSAFDVSSAYCNLEDPQTFASALDEAEATLGSIDTVVITAGLFATQDKLEEDPDFTGRLLRANFTNTVLFCEEARKRLLKNSGGTLCVFSSVAGDRGRKPVALYGASKAGLSHYLESLDHKFRSQGLKTVCIKPGFVKTTMTEGLKPPPFAAEAEEVAAIALKAIEKGTPVVYAPPVWGQIMRVIRNLPRAVMRKVNF